MKKKICVYTCITGDYDQLPKIELKEKGIDYFCFTNNKNLTSEDWEIILIEDPNLDAQRLSRKIKMLGHDRINQNYDLSVWMDATVVFKKRISEFVSKYYDEDKAFFSCFQHSSRNCIYEEAKACVRYRKDTKESIKKHIAFLEKEGYPHNNGLYEMTVFIKNHKNEKVKETMNLWFDMVCRYSKRDQLSFMYCVQKTGMKINPIPLNVWDNEWFTCNRHNFSNTIRSYRVYFDDGKDYNIDLDFQGDMNFKDSLYTIRLTVPCNTHKTIVELSRVPFLKLSNLNINEKKDRKIHYFNSLNYQGDRVFYNENGAFEIYDAFKKGDILQISMHLEALDSFQLTELLEDVSIKNQELTMQNESLQKENRHLNDELQKILNSKSWKFIRKFDKIRKKHKGK